MHEMILDLDLKVSTNITVLECPDEDDCGHRFAKDQSVKLSGALVKEVADAMEIVGGYSSLGDFVRECVRARTQHIQHQDATTAYGQFLGLIAQDPETWIELISGTDDEEE